MKHILVAADLTPRCRVAVERAVTLAKEHGAALTVCHVVDDESADTLSDERRASAKDLHDQFLESIEALGQVEFDARVAHGPSWQGILEECDAVKADTIVMGRHRESAWKEFFRGTTVDRVVRNTRVPVVVAVCEDVQPYQRGVVGIDFSQSARHALKVLHQTAPKAELELVHATQVHLVGHRNDPKPEELEEMLQSVAADVVPNVRVHTWIEEGWPYRVFSKQFPNDGRKLLALGIHNRTGFVSAVVGGVTEACVSVPQCDLLLVPPPN